MMEGIQNFLSACNVVVLSRGHSLFSVGRNVCMCTVQGTAVKDRHVWPVGPFVPASLGNQTQPRSWRIEHLQLALMQLWDADWQRANSVHPPPRQYLQIHFPLPAPQGIADNRETSTKISCIELSGRLQGPSVEMLFSSLCSKCQLCCLSPAASRLCVFFRFSLEIPPVQDVFYFTFEKAESLHRAWVTSSRPNAAVQPQIFASGSLHFAQGRGALLCAVTLAAGPAARWVDPTCELRRSKLLLHSDHLPIENSWIHARTKMTPSQAAASHGQPH